ncbi:MAG: DUF2652 domain-containing protein [Chloroflexota bacterium]|nr:DUF2652 domain-containing protein [Chloroflexota bacterium]
MANKGFFVITDISGYTEYLTGSELDHANEILQSLFDAQLAAVKHPFVISGFRGDAIFMYVPETNFIQAQSLLEAIENFYIVFAETLEQMQYNTTCTCRACKNMSILDLKMCIHYGEYLVQKLGDREELLGADVIVPHRMLKNHVIEQTGVKSYALFSDVAARKLNLLEYCDRVIPHAEQYEHIGQVPMCVHDLRPVWEREQAKRRKFVSPEEAWIKYEGELPYPPALIWEYLTNPALEAGFLGYDYAERTDALGGRVREEAQFHCAHGDLHVYSKVLDWKPFAYYTLLHSVLGLEYFHTRRLIPTESGARVCVYASQPAQPVSEDLRQYVQAEYDRGYNNLGAFIAQDIEKRKVTVS